MTKFTVTFNALENSKNYVTEELRITLIDSTGKKSTFISDGNYKHTNEFINDFEGQQDFKSFINNRYHYNGASHWQFFFSYTWPLFFFAIEALRTYERAVLSQEITEVVFQCDGSLYSQIFAEIIRTHSVKNKINVQIIPHKRGRLNDFLVNIKSNIWRLFRDSYNICVSFIFYVFRPRKEVNTLVFTETHYLEENRGKYEDRLFHRIFPLSDFKNSLIVYSGINSHRFLVKKYNKIKYRSFTWVVDPISYLLSKYAYRKILNSNTSETITYPEIRFNDFCLRNIFKIIINYIDKYVFFETILARYSTRRILAQYKPEKVLLTYETGVFQRAAIIEARKLGVLSCGFQHGSIFSNAPDYSHKFLTQQTNGYGYTIPDIFFVWGDYWKNVLSTQLYYPKHMLKVVGDWRASDRASPNKTKKSMDNLLFLASRVELDKFLAQTKEALTGCDFKISYRIHPSERKPELLAKYKMLKFSHGDLNSDLQKNQIVVSAISTSVLDSLRSLRPTIIYDHARRAGWDEFKHIEGVKYTNTGADLLKAVTDLQKMSTAQQRKFMRKLSNTTKSFYKHSGRESADAIIKVIQKKSAQRDNKNAN